MLPHPILVEAEDELAGIGVAEVRCAEEHDIRLVAADSSETETVGQVALPFQVRSRTGDEQTARVLVKRIGVTENRTADLDRRRSGTITAHKDTNKE